MSSSLAPGPWQRLVGNPLAAFPHQREEPPLFYNRTGGCFDDARKSRPNPDFDTAEFTGHNGTANFTGGATFRLSRQNRF